MAILNQWKSSDHRLENHPAYKYANTGKNIVILSNGLDPAYLSPSLIKTSRDAMSFPATLQHKAILTT